MSDNELKTVLIDEYTNLQRIKKANQNVDNPELEYQIKEVTAKLEALGVTVENLKL